jgi:ABC-2 type transport system ATP-binding protein
MKTGHGAAQIVLDNASRRYQFRGVAKGRESLLMRLLRPQREFVDALKPTTLRVERGVVVGLLGPNGAGKSTMLKLMSGLLQPTAGQVMVAGHVPWRRERAYLSRIAFLSGQRRQLTWDLPALDSFVLLKALYEISEAAYAEQLSTLSQLLQLEELLRRPVKTLSLGQRMRLELAACLLHRPDVIFLDEPSLGLDAQTRGAFTRFVRAYCNERSATVVLASHYLEEVEAAADRVLVISHGGVVYDGVFEELRARTRHSRLIDVRFSRRIEPAEVERFGALRGFSGFHGSLLVSADEAAGVAAALASNLPIVEVSIREQPVDDVLVSLAVGAA